MPPSSFFVNLSAAAKEGMAEKTWLVALELHIELGHNLL
jgi:hypothetical protein